MQGEGERADTQGERVHRGSDIGNHVSLGRGETCESLLHRRAVRRGAANRLAMRAGEHVGGRECQRGAFTATHRRRESTGRPLCLRQRRLTTTEQPPERDTIGPELSRVRRCTDGDERARNEKPEKMRRREQIHRRHRSDRAHRADRATAEPRDALLDRSRRIEVVTRVAARAHLAPELLLALPLPLPMTPLAPFVARAPHRQRRDAGRRGGARGRRRGVVVRAGHAGRHGGKRRDRCIRCALAKWRHVGRAGERIAKCRRVRPAFLRLLGQRAGDGVRERGRHVGTKREQRTRRLRHVLHEHRRRVGRLERRLAGEHLIADHAERVDVAPTVELTLAQGLLG